MIIFAGKSFFILCFLDFIFILPFSLIISLLLSIYFSTSIIFSLSKIKGTFLTEGTKSPTFIFLLFEDRN
jgi:hypothetical protein